MGFFAKLVSFFFKSPVPAEKHTNTEMIPPPLVMPEEAVELMKKIENDQLQELIVKVSQLQMTINILAKNQINLIQGFKQQEEMLVAIATIHEELLYQLEQGKILVQKSTTSSKSIVDEIDDELGKNNKKNGQWN